LFVVAYAQSRILIGKISHYPSCIFLEVIDFLEKEKKGEFTIQQRKKKKEIIEESNHQVNIPADVNDEEKKAMEQTGEDATSGW